MDKIIFIFTGKIANITKKELLLIKKIILTIVKVSQFIKKNLNKINFLRVFYSFCIKTLYSKLTNVIVINCTFSSVIVKIKNLRINLSQDKSLRASYKIKSCLINFKYLLPATSKLGSLFNFKSTNLYRKKNKLRKLQRFNL